MNYITDNEIDRILGKFKEHTPEIKPKVNPLDEYTKEKLRKEYSLKEAAKYLINKEKKAEVFTSVVREASVFSKTYAFLVDMSIVAFILTAFLYAVVFFGYNTMLYSFPIADLEGGIIILLAAVYVCTFFTYLAYFESVLTKTPGKMLLGIKILNKNNVFKSILRTTLFFIPFLGLLGLHNKVTGIKVVKSN